jgi:hypothetical protein
MPAHASIYQMLGMAFLALVAAVWALGLARMLRRVRFEALLRRADGTLPALPSQQQAPPRLESVELTPAEQDAFAGLVRQLGDGR